MQEQKINIKGCRTGEYKSKKIKVFPFAKFQAVLFALIGLLAGIVYSFGGFIIDLLVSFDLITSPDTSGLSYGTVLAFGALIGMPIIFSIFGFVLALIESFLFNLFARWIGKIELDFEKK